MSARNDAARHRLEPLNEFTTAPNEILQDLAISGVARGYLVILSSLPPNYRITDEQIERLWGCSGHTRRKITRELEAAGYTWRNHLRGKGGEWCGSERVWSLRRRPTAHQSRPYFTRRQHTPYGDYDGNQYREADEQAQEKSA